MKKKRLAARSAVACFLTYFSICVFAASVSTPHEVKLQRVERVDMSELWNSDGPHLFTSEDGLSVGLWLADSESAPVRDERTLAGFFAVGTGDVGEIPVAMKVWLKGYGFSPMVTKRFVERKGQVVLFFLPNGCASADLCADAIVALSVRLGEDGASVLVNGKPMGAIRGP